MIGISHFVETSDSDPTPYSVLSGIIFAILLFLSFAITSTSYKKLDNENRALEQKAEKMP